MFFQRPRPFVATATTASPLWELSDGGDVLAVDLDTLKNWLNIPLEDTFFDAEKTSLAKAAQAVIETHITANLTPTTWVGTLPATYDQIRIDRRPFRDVTKIEVVEASTGDILTVDPTTYIVGRLSQNCGVVSIGDGEAWPVAARRWDAMRITVTSGYDAADADPVVYPLPEQIKHAIKITTAFLDKARGDGGASGSNRLANTVWGQKHGKGPETMPDEAKALLSRFKFRVVGFC